MALVGNGRSVFGNNPGTYNGATSFQYGSYIKGGLRNRNVGAFDQRFSAYGNGHLAPSSFILPNRSGSISSYTESSGSITQGTVTLTPALPMVASSTLVITVTNAQLDKIASLVASGTLVISASSAALSSAAAMTGSGTLTITVSNANLGGIFPILASSSMSITGTGTSFLTALAFMEAEAGGPTELSPEGLANAVLDALLADHTISGSVGEALNSIGASANPWASLLASNQVPGTFGERVQQLLKTTIYLGTK
jgi:hypothetical protein